MIIVIIYRLDSGGRHDISHQHRAQEWRPADAADLRCHHRLGASGLGVSERTGRSERGGAGAVSIAPGRGGSRPVPAALPADHRAVSEGRAGYAAAAGGLAAALRLRPRSPWRGAAHWRLLSPPSTESTLPVVAAPAGDAR